MQRDGLARGDLDVMRLADRGDPQFRSLRTLVRHEISFKSGKCHPTRRAGAPPPRNRARCPAHALGVTRRAPAALDASLLTYPCSPPTPTMAVSFGRAAGPDCDLGGRASQKGTHLRTTSPSIPLPRVLALPRG